MMTCRFKHSSRRFVLFFLLACLGVVLSSCGSPLVGNACIGSLEFCGDACVDVLRSSEHCGQCGVTCDDGLSCLQGECRSMENAGGFGQSVGGSSMGGGSPMGGEQWAGGEQWVPLGGSGGLEVAQGGAEVIGGEVGGGSDHAQGGDESPIGGFGGMAESNGGLMDVGGGSGLDESAGSDAHAGFEAGAGGLAVGGSMGGGSMGDAGGLSENGGAGGEDDPPGCDVGQTQCGELCVWLASSFENCGECFFECDNGHFCVGGECKLQCEGVWLDCGGEQCFNSERDADHCGACNNPCDSGICRDAVCVEEAIGHLVVMGHDFTNARGSMQQILANAVFLHPSPQVRILSFEAHSEVDSVQGVLDSIARFMVRPIVITSVEDDATVPMLLEDTDVFVIHSQHDASDEILQGLGVEWTRAMSSFLRLGGVLILLDGGGDHSGTYQILEQAGLFEAENRMVISGEEVEVTAPGDAVALNVVALEYRAESNSVSFETHAQSVVRHGDRAVVVHKVILFDD